jgi:hypothetical protein
MYGYYYELRVLQSGYSGTQGIDNAYLEAGLSRNL